MQTDQDSQNTDQKLPQKRIRLFYQKVEKSRVKPIWVRRRLSVPHSSWMVLKVYQLFFPAELEVVVAGIKIPTRQIDLDPPLPTEQATLLAS